jgi:hypothetical protein
MIEPFVLPLLGLFAIAAPVERAGDPELAEAVHFIRDGDFETALPKLDGVVRRLQSSPPPRRELPMAHVYRGVCYLEMDRLPSAHDDFRIAQCLDPSLRLDPRSFSAQVMREFTASRDEHCRDVAAAAHKGSSKPLLLVLGGGAAVAGAALAAGGGGGQATTTTAPVGSGTTTIPTTTMPGATPTPTPTTTLPGPSTTTTMPGEPSTTTTTVPATTTTTTTLAACSFSLSPGNKNFGALGGSGTCNIGARSGCAWTASADVNWITLQAPTIGVGQGKVDYQVSGLTVGSRTGTISVAGSAEACTVTQSLLVRNESGGVSWWSELSVPGATGQVVLNGAHALFQEAGALAQSVEARPGWQRLEAQLVSSKGRPGTWRFELRGSVEPGSLRVIAGQVLLLTDRAVTFRIGGQPGERFVIVFRTASAPALP